MEAGCAVAAGRSGSRAASTVTRPSSKNGGSFIAAGNGRAAGCRGASRFRLPLGIEGLGRQLAIGFLQENFHATLGLFPLLLALPPEGHSFFEQLHRVLERKVPAFKPADDLLKPR